MNRLTKKNHGPSLKQIIKRPRKNITRMLNELSKDTALWRDVYTSSDDVAAFRKWLRLVHSPKNSRDLGEGYGATKINTLCGFMTYRYLYLCCKNVKDLQTPGVISNYADLVKYENNNCYIDYFIPQESLEDSLCEAVEKVRSLTHEEKCRIYGAKKTNSSKRSLIISDYYDAESIELVGTRDRLLIDKFGYLPPSKDE